MQILHCPSSGSCRGCCWSTDAGLTDASPSSCTSSCLRPSALLLCTYGLLFTMATVLRLGCHEIRCPRLSTQTEKRLIKTVNFPVLQSLYETWNVAFYTVFYTSVPVMLVAYFEQVRYFSVSLCIFKILHLHLVLSLHSFCYRMWVRKAAWRGRSCTDPVWDESSLPPSPCPYRSCMPSMYLLFISSSRVGFSATQPSTIRPWQSLWPCRPCLLPPLRSELHVWPTITSLQTSVMWYRLKKFATLDLEPFYQLSVPVRVFSTFIGQSGDSNLSLGVSAWCVCVSSIGLLTCPGCVPASRPLTAYVNFET